MPNFFKGKSINKYSSSLASKSLAASVLALKVVSASAAGFDDLSDMNKATAIMGIIAAGLLCCARLFGRANPRYEADENYITLGAVHIGTDAYNAQHPASFTL